MSADFIVTADITPNRAPRRDLRGDYDKFLVRTALAVAEGTNRSTLPSVGHSEDALQVLRWYRSKLTEHRLFILCITARHHLLAARSVSPYENITVAVAETALAVGASAVILGSVYPDGAEVDGKAFERRRLQNAADNCFGIAVLDLVVLHEGGGYSVNE